MVECLIVQRSFCAAETGLTEIVHEHEFYVAIWAVQTLMLIRGAVKFLIAEPRNEGYTQISKKALLLGFHIFIYVDA